MTIGYEVKRDADNYPLVDQGAVHGLPTTWNPDNARYYIHAAGTQDGTQVLGTFKHWRNAVAFAKRKAGG